jgi:UDP-galactopyranose mutase
MYQGALMNLQHIITYQHRLLAFKDGQLENFRRQLEAQQRLIEQLQENLAEEMIKRVDLEKQLELNSALLRNEEATRIAMHHKEDAKEADKLQREINRSTKRFRRTTVHNEKRKIRNKPRKEITLADFIVTK